MHAMHAAAHVQKTMDETVRKTAASKNGTLRISKRKETEMVTEMSDVGKRHADWFKKVGDGSLPIWKTLTMAKTKIQT